jgi:hypothetical protein
MKHNFTIKSEDIDLFISSWAKGKTEIIVFHRKNRVEISAIVSNAEKSIILNHDKEIKHYA